MNKITQHFYSYQPDEFFPVYCDGELDNRAEFVAYKAEQLAGALGYIAQRSLTTAAEAARVVMQHIAA